MLDFEQTLCIWWDFWLHLLWSLLSMVKMLSWKSCMAWSVLPPHLLPFLFLPFFILQYIVPGFLECYPLCICCLFPCNNPIHWLAFSESKMLIHSYCFVPCIKGLLIFGRCSWCLLFCYWHLPLKLILLPLLLSCLLLLPFSWYPSTFSAHQSLFLSFSVSCGMSSSNLPFPSS